jgi:hypothetical protein
MPKPSSLLHVLWILTFAFAAFRADRLPAAEPDFEFAVVGGIEGNAEGYEETVAALTGETPAFVFSVGKSIAEPGNASQWEAFADLSNRLSVPFYLTVSPGEVVDEETEGTYKDWVDLPGNELYYSFTYGNSHFIVLDTEEPGNPGRITGRQLDWLREELEWNRDQEHIFVFMHRPMYPQYAPVEESMGERPMERTALHNLLRSHRVDAVFNGEGNYFTCSTHDGVYHISTGAAGAAPDAPVEFGGYRHFLLVEVRGKKVDVYTITPEGNTREAVRLRKPAAVDKDRKKFF